MNNVRIELRCLAILLGFASADHAQQNALPGLPASFAGELPCADCTGIRYQLNLFPDHTFASRMIYEGRNTSFEDHGQWQLTGDGKTLLLQGKGETPEKFSVREGGTLRKLDSEGREIQSGLNYDLKRMPVFSPLESTASLENTNWKLIWLGGAPISAASPRQEPSFTLNAESHRVSGSGGCNRLMGGYELNGDRLTFSQMATTMMACAEGMDTEKAFLATLEQVKTWKIAGRQLELFDSAGKPVARFEAPIN